MRDFTGNEVKIGDEVVFMNRIWGAKIDLRKGVIASMGTKMVCVKYKMENEEDDDDNYAKTNVTPEKFYKIQKL